MSKQVLWNKVVLETFITEAMLSPEEEHIMRTRVAGWSRQKQAFELGISVPTIDRIIARLKVKYDTVARLNPILPPRVSGANELFRE